jgi:hypothetical protein
VLMPLKIHSRIQRMKKTIETHSSAMQRLKLD